MPFLPLAIPQPATVKKEKKASAVSSFYKNIHGHQQVVYWEDDTKPETMGKVRVPWNQTSVTVSGLVGNTQYFLTVSAFNTAGTGPFLPAINVTTKKPRESAGEICRCAAPHRHRQNQYLLKISFGDMVL